MPRTKVLLDTDIGDDIDDALALALICSLPDLQLVGVTTVFGNTLARARQAQTLLKLAGDNFAQIPVAVGCAHTLASRKNPTPVADPNNRPGQADTTLHDDQLPALHPHRGVDFLIDSLMTGDVIPITIGALTNLAVALTLEPRLHKKIPKIVTMAAEFQRPMPEWNIKCDPEAAHIVFASGIPMEVITFSIGRTAMMAQPDIDRLAASPKPLAKYLANTIHAWRNAWKNPAALPSLFDPMAVASIVNPGLFTWQTGQIQVELQAHLTYAYTLFTQGKGPHKVAWQTDREKAVSWYVRQIIGE